ncbi:MAG: hypothetical protein E7624_06110 [Ruminococcaceae bacterium]|nr:hypothetical protein [Oscillospiraceae bacterium]
MTYVTPNAHPGESDAKSIQNAIDYAVKSGTGRVRIPRVNERTGKEHWTIDETVYLPSDVEILFDDAHLVLANGCFCNMFAAHGGDTAEKALRNITLRGRGNAVLDGGHYNGLSERNSEKDGMPHISKNTTLLFTNVEGLVVEDLTLARQRWWAITNVAVRHARYSRIRFAAELSRVDEAGVHHPNEWPQRGREMYVRNADGIDLRVGCSDVIMEDIGGFTGDDTVALTALGSFERRFGWLPEGLSPDIHDVTVRRVDTETFSCAGVRLLNHNGNKLYNVTVEDVTLRHTEGIYRSHAAVSIGDKNYAERLSEPGETHHITVRNVRSAAKLGVSLCRHLQDSVIEHISATGDGNAVGVREGCTATLERCRLSLLRAEEGTPLCDEGLTVVE